MTGMLRVSRHAALAAVAVLVAAASLVSFGESYRGLYDWAREHGLSGGWAVAWPVQVDTFIAVGELALFVALADQWRTRSRLGAWAVTLAGLAVSVAGNIGHVTGHLIADRATAAVPPLAAAAALAVGLGVLKRVIGASPAGPDLTADLAAEAAQLAAALGALGRELAVPLAVPEPVPAEVPVPGGVPEPPAGLNGQGRQAAELFAAELAAGDVPSIRAIRSGLRVGQDTARQVQAYLRTLTRT